jgi:hypothetical protein
LFRLVRAACILEGPGYQTDLDDLVTALDANAVDFDREHTRSADPIVLAHTPPVDHGNPPVAGVKDRSQVEPFVLGLRGRVGRQQGGGRRLRRVGEGLRRAGGRDRE